MAWFVAMMMMMMMMMMMTTTNDDDNDDNDGDDDDDEERDEDEEDEDGNEVADVGEETAREELQPQILLSHSKQLKANTSLDSNSVYSATSLLRVSSAASSCIQVHELYNPSCYVSTQGMRVYEDISYTRAWPLFHVEHQETTRPVSRLQATD